MACGWRDADGSKKTTSSTPATWPACAPIERKSCRSDRDIPSAPLSTFETHKERPMTRLATTLGLAFLLALAFVPALSYADSSCGSDSDCAGYGRCSNGKCGACGSD